MLQTSKIVFDEHMQLKAGSASTTTSLDHTVDLTRADSLVIYVYSTWIKVSSTTGTLTVTIETSGDGRVWVAKNAVPEISAVKLNLSNQLLSGAEPSPPNPTMKYARLSLAATGTAGDVYQFRVGVAGRSRTKRVPRVPGQAPPPGVPLRRHNAVSQATMQELYEHMLGSTHLQGSERIEHVLRHLSHPARAEVETFTRKLVGMEPVVKRTIAHIAGALGHLMTTTLPEGDALSGVAQAFQHSASATHGGRSDHG